MLLNRMSDEERPLRHGREKGGVQMISIDTVK